MKKNNFKFIYIVLGFSLLTITTAFASNMISSAKYKDTKVTLDGVLVPLEKPLVAIVKEGETDASMYMPVRDLLSKIGYTVDWDEENNTVCLQSNVRVDSTNTIFKTTNWKIGFQYGVIDLQENSQVNAKWKVISISSKNISLANEEYLEGSLHRFNFRMSGELMEQDITVIFEKMLDGKPTGTKMIYKVYVAQGYAAKPVIYLYPTQKTNVSVSLDYDGVLTHTYPKYNNGWNVLAYPDGKLIDQKDEREYSYLFWEGKSNTQYDFSKGFVVKGTDTVSFLQEKLSYMGLTPKEYNEFIVYWIPLMQDNTYNFITFQQDAYTEHAKLNIAPTPDSMLRIFMAYKPLDAFVDVEPQNLDTFNRTGFSVIEWGGTSAN